MWSPFDLFVRVACKGYPLPLVLRRRQSMPRQGLLSATCLALTSVMVWMGLNPLFSARAMGITSRASAKALIAYCSKDGH